VEWNEINTAWGQTVLLLDSLARKLNLVFLRYVIGLVDSRTETLYYRIYLSEYRF